MKISVGERIEELRKKWKSGFHVVRVLANEGYSYEEVVLELQRVGYRCYWKPYLSGAPYVYVSELPDGDSVMHYLIWWLRDEEGELIMDEERQLV